MESKRWQTSGGDTVDITVHGSATYATVVKSNRIAGMYRINPSTLEAYTGDRRDDLLHPFRHDAEQLDAIIDLLRQILAVVSK
jgi:hypothetical protein